MFSSDIGSHLHKNDRLVHGVASWGITKTRSWLAISSQWRRSGLRPSMCCSSSNWELAKFMYPDARQTLTQPGLHNRRANWSGISRMINGIWRFSSTTTTRNSHPLTIMCFLQKGLKSLTLRTELPEQMHMLNGGYVRFVKSDSTMSWF